MRPVTRRTSLGWIGGAMATAFCAPARARDAATMLSRPIPSTGELLPVIGLGTWQTFDVADAPEARAPLREVLNAFAELGGKLIDSSPMYRRSEETAGTLVEELGLRDRLFIATKVWTPGKNDGIRQMRDSMRKLRAAPVDLMQVHNLVDVRTHLDTLRGWKEDGLVRYLGVTHYHTGGHDEVARLVEAVPLDFIQINYSAGEPEAETRLLPLARDRGVAVIANRPFAGGDLFARLREKPLPDWAAEIHCESWANLLLKFVISHPAITAAIPATSKVGHLRDNMRAGATPLPDETARKRILSLIR